MVNFVKERTYNGMSFMPRCESVAKNETVSALIPLIPKWCVTWQGLVNRAIDLCNPSYWLLITQKGSYRRSSLKIMNLEGAWAALRSRRAIQEFGKGVFVDAAGIAVLPIGNRMDHVFGSKQALLANGRGRTQLHIVAACPTLEHPQSDVFFRSLNIEAELATATTAGPINSDTFRVSLIARFDIRTNIAGRWFLIDRFFSWTVATLSESAVDCTLAVKWMDTLRNAAKISSVMMNGNTGESVRLRTTNVAGLTTSSRQGDKEN